jgi:hypothetical protein
MTALSYPGMQDYLQMTPFRPYGVAPGAPAQAQGGGYAPPSVASPDELRAEPASAAPASKSAAGLGAGLLAEALRKYGLPGGAPKNPRLTSVPNALAGSPAAAANPGISGAPLQYMVPYATIPGMGGG